LHALACREPRPDGVVFSGFEPFAHPTLPDAIAVAIEDGFERVRLQTDGGALAVHGNAEGAFAAGVRHLEIVLLGDPETHDRLACREGLFEAAVRGVDAFKAAASSAGSDIFVSGVLPLCAHNVGVAAAAVASFARLGAEAVELDAGRLSGAGRERDAILAALDTATVNGMHAWVRGGGFPAPYDRAPWSEMADTP
jgi:hypothetical protein